MTYLRGGNILRVNLTNRSTRCEPTEKYEDFIGGKAINLRLLFNSVDAGTDPLSPDNVLLFGAGPLVGTPFPGAGRVDVMGKSPVTGHYGNSGMGGYLGAELKYAGFDHLLIEGRSDKPVYLTISDNNIQIRDAKHLWGRDTYQTPDLIRQEIDDPKVQVVCIGPAGENKVVYAAIMSGTGNSAARTGMGAVMGAKNLKAIAVRGRKGIPIACPKEYLQECRALFDTIRQAKYYEEIHRIGLTRIHDEEMRRAHYLLGSGWADGEQILETEFIDKHLHRRVGCMSCPVACFDAYKIPKGGTGSTKCSPYGDLSWDVRNADLMIFWKAYVACQRYGLDARSLSNILAWLMTLNEKGIISPKDTDGLSMEWGNGNTITKMAEKISYRQGFGDLLAKGLPAASKKIGKGSSDYLMISKGSPSDMHVVPIKTSTLASAVSPIGEDAQIQSFLSYAGVGKYLQCENENAFQKAIEKFKNRTEKEIGNRNAVDPRLTEGKAALIRLEEERTDIIDMTGVCGWLTGFTGLPVDTETIARFLSLGFGKEVSSKELQKAATRMHHLERSLIGRCGLTREDDVVSIAHFGRVKPGGRDIPEINCTDEELEEMKDDYYRLMGWSLETGIPTRQTLEKYRLSEIADVMDTISTRRDN